MTYEFMCECKARIDIEASIKEGPPKDVICISCGKKMWQDLKGVGINIPDYMRAGEGDAHRDMVYRMKHASRPSGKKKVYY